MQKSVMNWHICSVGKPSFTWVRSGVAEYEKRIGRFARVEQVVVKTVDALSAKVEGTVWALDETGKGLSTRQLADEVRTLELEGARDLTVWIGGADGLTEELRHRADRCIALGRQTLMHELALLVWMEQVYRIHTLLVGHPYHRSG